MRVLIYIFVFCTLIFPLKVIHAQLIDFTEYGLEGAIISNDDYVDLIRSSVIDQPDFRSLVARKALYHFEYKAERSERFPSITSSIRNDRILDRKINDKTSIRKRQDDSTDFIVELNQPVYTGGTINKRIDNAMKQKSIGNLQLKKQASDLVIKANEIFLDLVRFSIYLNNLNQGISEIKLISESIELRIKSGLASPAEKALVQIRLNQLLMSRADVRAQLSRSKETFKRFFNKPFDSFSIPQLLLDNFSINDNKITATSNSINKSYDYLMSEIAHEQEKNNLSIARGEYRPKFGFNLRYTQYDFDDDFEENDIRGGFTFSMPIFDFGRGKNKILSLKSKVNEYQWSIETEKRNYLITRSEIENRIISVLTSIKEIKSTINNTRQQKKILLERSKLSEYNGVNLSDVISQDILNTQTLLDTELRLYIDDLRLSQIKTELLRRFRLKL